MPTIDLNSDLGEGYGPWTMGDDAAMLALVTSANVACGGHAGDPETMYETCRLAAEHGVVIGAHPSYADREGFGRRVIPMQPVEVGRMVVAQVGALVAVAALAGTEVRYVKPHGALGNVAAADPAIADAIVDAVRTAFPGLAILAISGSRLELAARRASVEVYSEVFADRGYTSEGLLVPRGRPGAMITDPQQAAERLVGFLATGRMPVVDGEPVPLAADSVCVHGDSPHAVEMARHLRADLAAAGFPPSPFLAR